MKQSGLFLLAVVLAGCNAAEDWPAEYPKSQYSVKQLGGGEEKPFNPNPVVAEKLNAFLLAQFGTPAEPKLKTDEDGLNPSILKGSRLYRVQCMYCHGFGGAGNGPSAASFNPRPRDYRRGAFKWKSTAQSQKPTRDDLFRVVHDGISGTSMPPFKLLPDEEIRQLVEYVIYLSTRGEVEYRLLHQAMLAPDKESEMKEFLDDFNGNMDAELNKASEGWRKAKALAVKGTRPDGDRDPAKFEASLQRGRELYLGAKAGCVKCHGVDGSGNRFTAGAGQPADEIRDVWGNIVQPRNFAEGVFRGGRTPVDIYRRIHQGIPASNMPGAEKTLKPEEIWDLVNFVRALQYRPDLLGSASAARPGG
jgi:mono/diheme cytochrome c family protein